MWPANPLDLSYIVGLEPSALDFDFLSRYEGALVTEQKGNRCRYLFRLGEPLDKTREVLVLGHGEVLSIGKLKRLLYHVGRDAAAAKSQNQSAR